MKRLFPIGLMGLGLLFMIGMAGFWIDNQKVQEPAPAPLPERVAGLSLTQSLMAEEAIAEFTRLHAMNFHLPPAL